MKAKKYKCRRNRHLLFQLGEVVGREEQLLANSELNRTAIEREDKTVITSLDDVGLETEVVLGEHGSLDVLQQLGLVDVLAGQRGLVEAEVLLAHPQLQCHPVHGGHLVHQCASRCAPEPAKKVSHESKREERKEREGKKREAYSVEVMCNLVAVAICWSRATMAATRVAGFNNH